MSSRLRDDSPFVSSSGEPTLRIRRFGIALIGGWLSAAIGFVIELINFVGDGIQSALGGVGSFASDVILRIWEIPLTVAGSSTAEFILWLEATGPFAIIIAVVAAVATGWAMVASLEFAVDQVIGVIIQ